MTDIVLAGVIICSLGAAVMTGISLFILDGILKGED